jgi:putative hydrolase of the HAD superfamily
MSPIDTVTFDVWNTLLVHEFYDDRVKLARIRHIETALAEAGFNYCREDILRAYDHSEACLADLWKNEMDASLEGHITLFLDGLGLDAGEYHKGIIRQPYANALLDFEPVLVDGAVEVLAALKERGFRIGLISNTGRTPGETIKLVLRDHGILRYFDSTVFSNETGYIKPNRRIFERALRELGSEAATSVHVGDSMLLDIYGARAAGMKAILFNKYSEGFERYAARYYCANGRCDTPDVTVERLVDVAPAIEALKIK